MRKALAAAVIALAGLGVGFAAGRADGGTTPAPPSLDGSGPACPVPPGSDVAGRM